MHVGGVGTHTHTQLYLTPTPRFGCFPLYLLGCRLEGGGLKQDTVIEPFQKKSVAVATLVNPRGAWSLKCKYSWRHEAPDESVVAAIVERDAETINRMVDAANDLDFGADSATIGDLRKKCQVRRGRDECVCVLAG